jgi:hypothetical protein
MRATWLVVVAMVAMVVGACGDGNEGTSDAAGDDTSDECSACAETATCDPEAPSPCSCPAGYAGDGTTAGTGCTDVDECTAGTDDCADAADHGTCTNTDGSYACGCEAGYDGDGTAGGTGCVDVDECTAGTDGCVDAPAGTCTNTDGGFTCGCEPGYTGDGTVAGTGCTDIDECTDGTAECDGFTCANTGGSFICQGVYAVSPFRGVLARLSPTTYELFDVTAITNTAGAVTGVPAMTTHPTTGVPYAVAKVSGVSGRVFGTLDFATATLTAVGDPVPNFSSLAFLPDGTLYGVTGNGGTPAETMFQIDPATGVPTLFSALGNGEDGEVICFNPDENMMYHWSGNGTAIMEKFALTLPLTFVPVAANIGTGEVFGCRYVGANTFLLSDIASSVDFVATDGTVSPVPDAGALFDDLRALIPAAMTQPHTVRPITGDVAGGTEITIRGIGLSAATAVNVGGTAATSFTIVDDTTITAVVPAGAAGTVDVTVTLTADLVGTWPDAFTYAPAVGARAPAHKVAKRKLKQRTGPSTGELRKAARGRAP